MRRTIQISVLVVSSIVLTLGATELFLRLAGYQPNNNPRLQFDPTLGWTLNPKWERFDHIRADGFRHTASSDPGSRRR